MPLTDYTQAQAFINTFHKYKLFIMTGRMLDVSYSASLRLYIWFIVINKWQTFNCFFFADLYYGGDTFSVEQPQSFTCPYCGKMGYTETSLQEHVTSEHAETSTEVVSILLALRTFLTSDAFVTNKVTYHIVFASQEGAWSPEHFHRPLAYFIVLSVDAEVVFFFFFFYHCSSFCIC